MPTGDALRVLRHRLAEWFERNARPLPWRETTDAYRIWLSEVILQQTQVVQGMSYYHSFVAAFPTVYDLAAASEDDVLRLWQGLGYYSRGRNLLRAAQLIVSDHGGELPRDPQALGRLPGIGPYTRAAILSFAYDLPYAAVDGNVYRVISRLDACPTPIDTPVGQRHYQTRATELLDIHAPGRHNQAMIELGALVCSPRKPMCMLCPLESFCLARWQGTQQSFPVKQGKVRVTERYLHYFLVRIGDDMLIRRRPAGDIWQGLYELPLIETDSPCSSDELFDTQGWQTLLQSLGTPVVEPRPVATQLHRLTHRLLHASLYTVQAEAYTAPGPDEAYLRIPCSDRGLYGMPILIDKLLAEQI